MVKLKNPGKSKQTPVERALSTFEEARGALAAFVREHRDLYDELLELVDAEKRAFDEAKLAISESGAEDTQLGPFRITAATKKVIYDPDTLPDEVLRLPGVLTNKSVSAKVLDQLVLQGKVDPDVVSKSRSEEVGRPTIRGPKVSDLNVDLS